MASILTIVDKERNKIIEENAEELNVSMDPVEEMEEETSKEETEEKSDLCDKALSHKSLFSSVSSLLVSSSISSTGSMLTFNSSAFSSIILFRSLSTIVRMLAI